MASDASATGTRASAIDVPDARTSTDRDETVYVFCLARASAAAGLDGAGLDGDRPLELVVVGQVAAVVSAINVGDFCGPTAEARMRNLEWTGPRVCRHEEVVEQVMRASPVVPARFATLFTCRASVVAWLERHHAAIVRLLAHFADHQEWAVKATLDRRQAEAPLVAELLRNAPLAALPGARYLEERRLRARVAPALGSWLAEECGRVARRLLLHAVEFRVRAVGPAVAEEGELIRNWAFLVRRECKAEFLAGIDRTNATYREQGLALACSGPWPPYSFCPPIGPGRFV